MKLKKNPDKENNLSSNEESVSQNKNIFEILENDDLEQQLLEWLKLTPLIWKVNKNNWVELFINEWVWHWHSHKSWRIEIWDKPVPNSAKKAFWLPENTSWLTVKQYIFSHENNHHVLFYLYKHQDTIPEFAEIFNKLKYIRENTGKWLSELGSMGIYNSENRDTAHEEDFVELLNMYCIHPKRLKRHLDVLVNGNEEVLQQKWLQKIPEQFATWLFENIWVCVGKFLQENWVIDGILETQ